MNLHVTPDELETLLVDRLELIEPAKFARARILAARQTVPLEQVLVEQSLIPVAFLLEQLASFWEVSFIDLKLGDIEPQILRAIPEKFARAHTLMPFALKDRQLHVAMWNPRDRQALAELAHLTQYDVVPYLAPEHAIHRAHLLYRGNLRAMLEQFALSQAHPENRPHWAGAEAPSVVDLLTCLLEYAAVSMASDIHIEPFEFALIIRYRIDGVLHEVLTLLPTVLPALVSRIKILAGMRMDERRIPQDGRFEADLHGCKIELRVSSLPTMWGEKIVLRVLSKQNIPLTLENLGLTAGDYATVLRYILRPFGMILLVGPTGCGKTTSLYAMLMQVGMERLNVVNISTIEDPIEYTIPRVNQVQVNSATGLGYAAGLRALLRQDPDIIMVGEIRDYETAEFAVRAALIGRLLFSTLHTNDATGAVPRLLDIGVEPYLISSTLVLVIAQRLVRRICVHCRESIMPDRAVLQSLHGRPDFEKTMLILQEQGVLSRTEEPLAGIRFFHGKGCQQCHGSGFQGRLGVFELFEVDDHIRSLIMEWRDHATIRAAAITRGMKTMFQDGLAKVLLGETTLEEVYRVAL